MNINLDPYRMFPQAARRVEVLEELKRSWRLFVGDKVARYSLPYNLGVDYLCVAVSNQMAQSMLAKNKGTIARRMAKLLDYDHI